MDQGQFTLHAELEDTHWWFFNRREIILDRLLEHVERGASIAEIGCGTGGNLKRFKAFYQTSGVDVSPEAIGYARGRIDCPLYCGDFRTALDGRWEGLRGVVLADVLEHIDDDAGFLRDLVERMAPGSTLVITVPAHQFLWSNHDLVLGHCRRYSRRSLRALWRDLPVRERYFSPFMSILFPAVAAQRLLERRVRRHRGVDSDLQRHGPLMNRLLGFFFGLERPWLRHASLPIGCSFLAVLQKDGNQ